MVVVTALHHHHDAERLLHVIARMSVLGPPVIRAYHDAGYGWFALEGTHRLRAAMLLGVAPAMLSVGWWRSREALQRARFAALLRGHHFSHVEVI